MSNKDIIDMIVRQHNIQNITTKRLKIHSIHKDIIRLKQENRNIGDKVRSFDKQVKTNCLKPNSSITSDYTYSDRIKRDLTTIEYLRKLQEYNSNLINRHRSKVRELKKELSAMKGETQ